MSKENQIKEIQTVVNGAFFEDFRNGNDVCLKTISEHLYNAGYRKQSEWISVEERLPKHLEKVLVCDTEQKMVTAMYIDYGNGNGDWGTAVRLTNKVTHWMPIPEPPKMKGGAE